MIGSKIDHASIKLDKNESRKHQMQSKSIVKAATLTVIECTSTRTDNK
jgi:hypothetical protein